MKTIEQKILGILFLVDLVLCTTLIVVIPSRTSLWLVLAGSGFMVTLILLITFSSKIDKQRLFQIQKLIDSRQYDQAEYMALKSFWKEMDVHGYAEAEDYINLLFQIKNVRGETVPEELSQAKALLASMVKLDQDAHDDQLPDGDAQRREDEMVRQTDELEKPLKSLLQKHFRRGGAEALK